MSHQTSKTRKNFPNERGSRAHVSPPRLKDAEVKAKGGWFPFVSRSARSLDTVARLKIFKKPKNF